MTYRLNDLNERGIPPLLEGVQTREEWEAKRSRILTAWMETVGGLPERAAPAYRVLGKAEEADHTRIHIAYAAAGGQVTAFLLVPRGPEGQRYPAVMALHPTHPSGKADVATPEGRENRRYGLELVARGYVVLAPDVITVGERVYPGWEPYMTAPYYAAHPSFSVVGQMLSDHMQGVDLLCTLPMVDPGRIGAIGHSLGGYNAFFLAGLDSRVRAVVASCGLSPFAGDPDPRRWDKRAWFSHLPLIGEALARGEVPFELHEIAALAAPTPFFQWAGQTDHIFPHWQSVAEASLDLARLYDWHGVGDRYVGLMGSGGHDFPLPIRAMAYEFLDRWLSH